MVNKKIIIAIVAAIVVIGGAVGTVIGVNAYNDKKEKEAQEATFKEYNDKINAIVTPLNVADANGQNPSIENNTDINALQTAIASLQGLEKEVTDNTILTEEQKNTLKGTITNSITGIQNRINAVNEANAEAQRQAEAEAQRQQAEAQARAEASKSSSSTSNNKSRANNGGSSSSGRSSSSGGSSNSGGSSAPADSGNSGGSSGGSSDSGSSGGSSGGSSSGGGDKAYQLPDGSGRATPFATDGFTIG